MAKNIPLRVKRRRYVTLIEMMIVMFLIALIAGVVAFNYQASLETGKAFKTEQGIEKISTVLTIQLAENPEALDNLESNWHNYLKSSPLVRNAEELYRDGWGDEYQVQVIDGPEGYPEVRVSSRRLEQYRKAQGK